MLFTEKLVTIAPVRKQRASNGNTFRSRKNYGFHRNGLNGYGHRGSYGKGSIMLKREQVAELEKAFCELLQRPTEEQMYSIANRIGAHVETVDNWFTKMWKGKLNHEWWKAQSKHNVDSSRTREVKRFEPIMELDDSFNFVLQDEDYIIEHDNAEEDYSIEHDNAEEDYIIEESYDDFS